MRTFLAMLFLVLLTTSCSQEETFEVDPAMLAPFERDETLGLRFHPPAGFQAAGRSFLEEARGALANAEGSDGLYFTVPRMLFAIPSTQARIFVGEFPNDGMGPIDEAWWDGYLAAAREKAGNFAVKDKEITLGDLPVRKLRIEGAGWTNDRLVFVTPAGRRVQIDYLIPEDMAERLDPAVRSSIGALEVY